MKKFSSATTLLFVFSMIALTSAGQQRLASGSTYKDVVIATVDDMGENFQLRSNIYLPEEPSESPLPLLLYIHGNGGAYNFANGSTSYERTIELSKRGIAVATVDYRPATGLPEDIYDVKAYIRYFRANAEKYNIDPDRIGIWGTSRGGNLATIIATTGDSPEHEGDVGGNLKQSSTIQYAVIFYPFISSISQNGTTAFMSGINREDSEAIREAYDNNDTSSPFWEDVERIEMCNAINYVDENDPPVFIAHGSIDRVCSPQNSLDFYNAYVSVGVPAWLQFYSLGPHGTVSPQIEKAAQDWMLGMMLGSDSE